MKKFEINERVILTNPNSVFGGEVVNITKINKQQYEIKHINGDYSSVNERNLRKLPKKGDRVKIATPGKHYGKRGKVVGESFVDKDVYNVMFDKFPYSDDYFYAAELEIIETKKEFEERINKPMSWGKWWIHQIILLAFASFLFYRWNFEYNLSVVFLGLLLSTSLSLHSNRKQIWELKKQIKDLTTKE